MQTLVLVEGRAHEVQEARPDVRGHQVLVYVALAHQLAVGGQSLELDDVVVVV